MSKQINHFYEFGKFRIDLAQRLLLRDGEPLPLTPKAFDTLLALVENRGRLVEKDELMNLVWHDSFVEEANLANNVSLLRKVLGDGVKQSQFIQTIPRRGYRFVAQVNEIFDDAVDFIIEKHTQASLTVEHEEHNLWSENEIKNVQTIGDSGNAIMPLQSYTALSAPLANSILWRRKRKPLLMTLGVVLLATAGGIVWYVARRPTVKTDIRVTPVALSTPRQAVAVLGFRNLSGRSDADWLSTAFAEMLGTELATGEKLRIIAGEDVARMRIELALPEADSLAPNTLRRIRANLGTDLVILGSYSVLAKNAGGQIRLDLRVQDAETGETMAAIAETGNETELFDVVSRLGAKLRERLGIRAVSSTEISIAQASRPANAEAARFYAEGLNRLRTFDVVAARELFEKAIAADPKFPLAYSALAAAWKSLGYDMKAREAAKKAFNLSASLSREERLIIEGRYYEANHDWDNAIRIYRTLYELFPDNLEYGLRLTMTQYEAGRGNDVAESAERLKKLPPAAAADARVSIAEASAAEALSDFRHELEASQQAAEKAVAQGASLLLAEARYYEGWSQWNLGDNDKALVAYDEARRLYAAAGYRRRVADLINVTAIVLWTRGDLAEAKKNYLESLRLSREIGCQSCVAAILNNIANVARDQDELAEASKYYTESLSVYREINNIGELPGTMNNLANILRDQGDLTAAKKLYEEALARAREMNRKKTIAFSLEGLAKVALSQGDLGTARQLEEEFLTVANEIERKESIAAALEMQGELLFFTDKADDAKENFEKALAIQNEIVPHAALQTHLALAKTVFEAEHYDEAATQLAYVNDYTQTHKDMDPGLRAVAQALLAQLNLVQGRLFEAQRAIGEAQSLVAKSQYREAQFTIAIAAARVRATAGKSPEAIKMLESTANNAMKAGNLSLLFETRLALGEIEMKSGRQEVGRNHLSALEKEARAKGFDLIARKASAAIG